MMEEPRCSQRNCKHFQGVKYLVEDDESSEVVYCAAFPDGIPDDIAYGGNKHLSPVEGDHGIQFERADPETN